MEQDEHLATCRECGRRWSEMQAIRADFAGSQVLSTRQLAAQRQQIWDRIEQPAPPLALKWAPALAVAFLIAMGVFLFRPATPVPPVTSESDSQLFTDVYTMEQTVEPRAAAPIRALFEEEQ
jgi:hypothetical protein